MSKRKTLRRHARRRTQERYGLDLTQTVRDEIIAKIRRGAAHMVERQSLRVSVQDVLLSTGDMIRVVYDNQRRELVTVLSRDEADCPSFEGE